MTTQNARRFYDKNRMTKESFLKLVTLLRTKGGLIDTRKLSVEERVMIFIDILKGTPVRDTAETWQHSNSTISHTIKIVSNALLLCQGDIFVTPSQVLSDNGGNPPDEIRLNHRFSGFFDQAIGAVDGTKIPASVKPGDEGRFRDKKGNLTWNILISANFDLTVSYAMVGFEGSAHDQRVLGHARGLGFPIIPGKFYLADAGYKLTTNFLVPYRGVRYHLKEWEKNNKNPMNEKELFNLRHSSARNVIERVNGIAKKRFGILVNMPSYSYEMQSRLIMCALILHTFIRRDQQKEDETFDKPHPTPSPYTYSPLPQGLKYGQAFFSTKPLCPPPACGCLFYRFILYNLALNLGQNLGLLDRCDGVRGLHYDLPR